MVRRGVVVAAAALAVVPAGAAGPSPRETWTAPSGVAMTWGTIVAKYGKSCTWCPETLKAYYWTTDHGKHWRLVWRGVADDARLDAVPTSSRAAVISAGEGFEDVVYWTRDGGRHWYVTRVLPRQRAFASAGRLFWVDDGGMLNELRPWPPTAKVSCPAGAWTGVAKGRVYGLPELYPRTICERVRNAGMRRHSILGDGETAVTDAAAVPRGVAAVVNARGGTGGTDGLVLLRAGTKTDVTLPPIAGVRPRELVVSWPRIVVIGWSAQGPGGGAWWSSNGGVDWFTVPPADG